jgi:hypothetical protein
MFLYLISGDLFLLGSTSDALYKIVRNQIVRHKIVRHQIVRHQIVRHQIGIDTTVRAWHCHAHSHATIYDAYYSFYTKLIYPVVISLPLSERSMLLVYAVEMQSIEVNGASIAYLEGGSPSDPLALCLHGFPDTAYTWRHLMPVLVSHGWHVVCPNLRGFAPTKAPHNDAAGSAILGADANALHKVLGGDERAVLIGHDWGAAAAYKASFEEPDCWSKVITSAWPPSPSNIDFFSFEQMKRSWCIFTQS